MFDSLDSLFKKITVDLVASIGEVIKFRRYKSGNKKIQSKPKIRMGVEVQIASKVENP